MFRTYAKASATREMVVKVFHVNSVINDSNLDRLDTFADFDPRGHGVVCLGFKDQPFKVCHALNPLVLGGVFCDFFSACGGLVSSSSVHVWPFQLHFDIGTEYLHPILELAHVVFSSGGRFKALAMSVYCHMFIAKEDSLAGYEV